MNTCTPQPLTVEIATSPDLEVGTPAYPPAHPFTVQGLDEEFLVLDGHLAVVVPIAVNVVAGRGEVVIHVTVRYQACSDKECLPPSEAGLEIRLQEAPPG